MKDKFVLSFYVLSIFLMFNDGLSNALFGMVGVNFWRQLIWIATYIILFHYIRQNDISIIKIRQICKSYKKLFSMVTVLALVTMLVDNFNIVRIIYAFYEYSFGVPFILFPYIWRKCGYDIKYFYKLFIGIGMFLSIGLLVDYGSGGLITAMFALSSDAADYSVHFGRHNFLSTTDSIFSIYYSLCLLSCFFLFNVVNKKLYRLLLMLISMFFVFSSIFCGARQTLACLCIAELFGLYSVFKNAKSSILLVFVTSIIVLNLLPSAQNFLSDNKGFQSRYTSDAIKEDERGNTWEKGLDDCFLSPSLRRITIGDGVGLTMDQHAYKSEKIGPHYENTFLARISELGLVVGLWSLLIPFYYFKRYRTINRDRLLYLGFIASWFFISLISPNGASNQSQMTLFFVLGMALMYSPNYSSSIIKT